MTEAVASELTWTVEDIARYYRRSVRQARRIKSTPGFPSPLRGDNNRWHPSAVIKWAENTATVEADTSTVLRHDRSDTQRVTRPKRDAA